MTLAHRVVILLATEVLFFVQYLSNVLYNKTTLLDVLKGKQPEAFQARSLDLKLGVLAPLKPLVLALFPRGTESIDTLDVEHAIQAVLVVTRDTLLAGWFALADHDIVLVQLLRLSMSVDIVSAENCCR